MSSKKSNKRSLLLSALSLLMCVSMLIGSTFAWFTDSVESGINKIIAGNLDVDVYYGKEEVPATNSVAGKENIFTDVTNNADILWEPGAMAYTNLNVVNKGTLALKYQLAINFENATTNANGDTLAKVLKVGFVTGGIKGATREAVLAEVAQWQALESFAQLGTLAANKNAVYGVVIYWEPSAIDNEFNMNNGQTGTMQIDLGINLIAAQHTAENDSFNEYYDESAAVFTVEDANKQLAEGKNVNLVNCNEPEGILYVPANYSGVLVLNNVKIASIQETAAVTVNLEGEIVASAKAGQIVILGDVVVQATQEGMSAITGTNLDIIGNGNLTAIAKGAHAYGIGGPATKSIRVKGVTIKEVAGGCVGVLGTDLKYYKDAAEGGAAIGSGLDGAVITLSDVQIDKATGGSKAAAIGACYHIGVTVNIENSVIKYAEGGATAAAIGGSRVSGERTESGTTINISGSTITAKGGVYGAGIGSGYDTHCKDGQPVCTINISNSAINATGGQYAAGVGTGYHNAALAGEIKNSTINAVSGDKFYKNTYTAAMDLGFGVVDPAREGKDCTSAITVDGKVITLADAPAAVDTNAVLAAALENGATLVLTGGDFTLPSLASLENVTIIGAADGSTKLASVNSFGFGENTVLKNVTFKASNNNSVRYGYTKGDVVFENCVFEGKQFSMHIDGANNGTVTFNGCSFNGRVPLAATGTYTFNNCSFKNSFSNYNSVNVYSVASFNNCTWKSGYEINIDSGAKAIVNGSEFTQRVYMISDAKALESFQRDVNSKGKTYANVVVMLTADIDMKDAYYANWTPIGQTGATQFMGTFDGMGYTIKNLNIDSTRQTGANYSTGLFGWLNSATVKNVNIDNATIKGNHNVGVIAGYMETSGCTISNCHVTNATITATHINDDVCGDKVGVIVGHAGNSGVKVEGCSAKDCTVIAGRDAGQIVGAALTANVTGCTATNVAVTADGTCTGANVKAEVIGRVLG